MTLSPKDSVILNVCVIPRYFAAKKCVELSQSLKSDATMFVLDGVKKFPHMTVFMARFQICQIDNVISATGRVLSVSRSFECKHIGYFRTAGRYVEVSYQKSPAFALLHELVTETLKGYRINPGNPYQESYFDPYTAEQQENAKETGYDLARQLFRPHVTLTRYFEGQAPEKVNGFGPIDLSFPLQTICVYKADDNGAVYEEVARFAIR